MPDGGTVAFVLSKLGWAVAQPSNLLLIALATGCGLLLAGRQRAARRLLLGTTLALALIGLLPVGQWLLQPLESRFPPATLPAQGGVDGIVVLGGAIDLAVSERQPQTALNDAGERLFALIELARRYPQAPVIYTDGLGQLLGDGAGIEQAARRLLASQGVPAGRVRFDATARNTYDNALIAKRLAAPKPGQRWLLVTSASHMPRAVGIFRKVGWDVIAYPVDYTVALPDSWRDQLGSLLQPDIAARLEDFNRGSKAWVGLVAYWLMGRTSALLPGP